MREQALEAATPPPPADDIEPQRAAPTATGPLGTKAPRLGARPGDRDSRASEGAQTATGPAPAAPRLAARDDRISSQRHEPANREVAAADDPKPPLVARLPGYILEVPPQQAYHDQNESSFH